MKRKHESDDEIHTKVNCGNADEFRDQLLEQNEFVRVIKLSGKQPNLALPQDWVGMYHKSGGIIYLNRKTRVCTWARPYHIGQASVRKHEVPAAAIPCLHQIMALNNKKTISNKTKEQEPLDIHDGIVGHQTGNLDNQSGRHDNHHGNYGNEAYCDVNPTVSSVNQSSDLGYHSSRDGSTVGNCENKSGPNVEGCHGNNNAIQSDENISHGSDTDGDHANHDGNQTKHDGDQIAGILDGTNDGDLTPDGNHSNPDGTCPGNITNTDVKDEASIVEASKTALSSNSLDSTNDINMITGSDVVTAKNKSVNTALESGDGTINTVHENTDITAINKAISSMKASEKCDSDSESGRTFEKPKISGLQMCSVEDISSYLEKRWEFHDITKEQERKLLLTDTNDVPEDTTKEYKSVQVLKSIPYLVQGVNPNSKNERVVINPAGKSARSLLHEYCLKVMQVKPEYETSESSVPKTPFLATVLIDGLKFGSGMAASKKQAKHVAAQKTLEILMPHGSFEKLMDVEENLKIFDEILIEDPNVYELTSKLGLISPSQALSECIKRNQGVLTSKPTTALNHGEDKQLYFTMECGKHKTTVWCRNKKMGRELASQAILQKLHPHLKYWGSVLRIYVDEHTTQEFSKPEVPAPTGSSTVNMELLHDLKQEMWKLMKKTTKTSKDFNTNIDI